METQTYILYKDQGWQDSYVFFIHGREKKKASGGSKKMVDVVYHGIRKTAGNSFKLQPNKLLKLYTYNVDKARNTWDEKRADGYEVVTLENIRDKFVEVDVFMQNMQDAEVEMQIAES